MDHRKIDYYTIAGLVIFIILSLIYIFLDDIRKIFQSFSQPGLSADGGSLPQLSIPDFSMDWFNSMDTGSQIILGFLAAVLVGSAIGCTLIYLKYRQRRTG